MSHTYKNDKEKMNKEAKNRRDLTWQIIKITFVTFAAFLLVFCVTLVVSLMFGNKDEEAPIISGSKRVIGYCGDTPVFKKMVTVSDNTDVAPHLEINASSVDIYKEGEYAVYYQAIDESGNKSSVYKLIYVVKSKQYHIDTLMQLIEEKADELGITKEMTTAAKIKKIYSYVNNKNTIMFTDESNIPNINRSNWETDWIEEAVRTLETEEGDCYSYYALSKAFFEYFGIENVGIKRSENYPGAVDDGTHFWSAVKVEQSWYYYDATRLAGEFEDGTNNACLITEKKLKSYKGSNGEDFFYNMTKPAGFPTIATKELG